MREIAKMFYMLFLVFTLLAVPISASTETTMVGIGNVEIMPNSSVTIPIMVNGVTNLGLGKVTVTYTPSVVHVTNVASGTGNALIVTSYNITNSLGLAQIVAHDPTTPHNGSVIFANVTYKAVGDERSSTTLNITARLYDYYYPYPDIPHTITNGTFTVTPSGKPIPTATPPPSKGGGGGGGAFLFTPSPTLISTATQTPTKTPSPTLAPTITPPTTPAQTPASTIPPAEVPVISWSIILVAIFISVIIILTGYLLMKKKS